ncbi:MAG: NAD-dependent epimerase/dehydratase family protein [Thermodesulfobacteriota bacterium]
MPVINNNSTIACVTGGTGMVGSHIVNQLTKFGYSVRILSRNKSLNNSNIDRFYGDIRDSRALQEFLSGAALLFHCAGELVDQSIMWDVNVGGTELLIRQAEQSKIKFFCYISSAGVVGLTDQCLVDEETPCNPVNYYEKSKWAAEQIAAQGIDGCKVVILRPTNVIDEYRPGALTLPQRGSILDRFQVLVKGGECAHIIHAEDVASAAFFSLSLATGSPQIYFVSCDHEPYNTFAGLWSLYRTIQAQKPVANLKPIFHLPIIIPQLVRRLRRQKGNRGDVLYSSRKLRSTGFQFPLGVKGAVSRIILSSKGKPIESVKC